MNRRRWVIGGTSVVGAVLVAAATAWACVSGPAVNMSTVHAKPSQEVHVTGTNFSKPDPVTVRWNALDGPILAALPAPTSGEISARFSVPADAKPGNYVLIITQTGADGRLSETPVRALLTVTAPDGASGAPTGGGRAAPSSLLGDTTDLHDGVSGLPLLLLVLGVAGVGMLSAGMAAVYAGRHHRQPEAVRAHSSL